MAYTYKILGQSLPANTNVTDLYTCPSSSAAVISQLVVCNNSAAPVTFRVSAAVAGAADATSQYLLYDVTVDPNDTLFFDLGATLAGTDKIRVKTGTASALSFTLFGTEIA